MQIKCLSKCIHDTFTIYDILETFLSSNSSMEFRLVFFFFLKKQLKVHFKESDFEANWWFIIRKFLYKERYFHTINQVHQYLTLRR